MYRRRFRRRKRTYRRRKRRRFFRPGYSRTKGFFNRFNPGGELKFFESVIPETINLATWSDGLPKDALLFIPIGTGEQDRIGRKITVRGLYIHGSYCILDVENATAPIKGARIRTVLFLDKQCNGESATGTDIFEGNNLFSFRNLSNVRRFKILYDKTTNINFRTLSENTDNLYSHAGFDIGFNIYLPHLNIPIEYSSASSTTGNVSERQSNNIGIMHVLEDAAAANDRIAVEVSGRCRVRFSDR